MCCVAAHQALLLELQDPAPLTETALSSRTHSPSRSRSSAVAVAVAVTAARSRQPAARARRELAIVRVPQSRCLVFGAYAGHVRPPALTCTLTGA